MSNPFKFYVPGAISFRGRSPFETRQTPGLPSYRADAPNVVLVNGAPTVDGIPLPPSDIPPQDSPAISSQENILSPVPQFDPSKYSDSITFAVVFGGAGEALVLRRPQTTRILLLIQNLTVLGNIFYTFDRTADNVTCIAIGAGGNRLWDTAVPQGDVHIFSTGAGTVTFEYMNRDISKRFYR